jgi:hypothetical protein
MKEAKRLKAEKLKQKQDNEKLPKLNHRKGNWLFPKENQ